MSTSSTRLDPYTHQWAHDEVIQIDRTLKSAGVYADPQVLSSVIDIPTLKQAVVQVINDNIGTINRDFPEKRILPLIIKDEKDIVQGDTTILPDGVFTHLTGVIINNNTDYKTCKGPACPNAIAYIQYYVALACKCVSIDETPKAARDGNECHKTLLDDATADFNTTVGPSFLGSDPYISKIQGTEFTVSINAEKDGCNMKLYTNTNVIITVKLTEYEPSKVRCICLICLYYFMTRAMLVNPSINETNLLNMIECWKNNEPWGKQALPRKPFEMSPSPVALTKPKLPQLAAPGWNNPNVKDPNGVANVVKLYGGSRKPKVKAKVSLNRDTRSRS